MKLELYDKMFRVESYHWWFTGKKRIVVSLIERLTYQNKDTIRLADFGCGCGLMLGELKRFGEVTGIDMHPLAIKYCHRSFDGQLVQADLSESLHMDNVFDIGVALDIIEHIRDDNLAIKNIWKSLKPGGYLVLTVPAFQWLWSQNDINNMHYRRYNRKQLSSLLHENGFTISYLGYYNFFLFLPAAIIRVINKFIKFDNNNSVEMSIKDGVVNRILREIFAYERVAICNHKHFPFGLSLIAVAKKDKGAVTANYD